MHENASIGSPFTSMSRYFQAQLPSTGLPFCEEFM